MAESIHPPPPAAFGPGDTDRRGRQCFDVAIVGAGPAGSAAARRLALAGCTVLLIERSRFDSPRVGESLAPSVQPLLRDLGVWPRFEAMAPWPSWGTRSLWGSDTPESHTHMLSAYGCGWHVDRRAFDRMLADAAVSVGTQLLTGTTVASCERAADGLWQLRLARTGRTPEDGPERTVSARWLLDASGRSASLSRSLGGQRLLFDNLVAVAAQWGSEEAAGDGEEATTQHVVLVETVPEGWWYSAPVPQAASGHASTHGPSCEAHRDSPPRRPDTLMGMLLTDADLCGRHDLAELSQWQRQLRQAPATRSRLLGAGRQLCWGPRTFSAVSQRLCRTEFDAPWLSVGDAALSVDPISGSGVVRALRTAKAAAETVLDCLQATGEPTRSDRLQAYEAERDGECTRYLMERSAYYAEESRWDRSPFWQRRTRRPQPAMA